MHFLIISCQRVGLGKEVQIYTTAHRLISLGIQVQPVVLKQELRLHGFGILRVTHSLVEVDDAIEHLRRTNPCIDCVASLLMVSRVVAITLERSDGSAKDIDALLMGLTDNLLVDLDDTLSRLHAIACVSQVVDSLKKDDPLHSFLSKQVTRIAARTSRA